MIPAAQARDPQTYAIIGAAMEVHKELRCGFLEEVYREALETEFERAGVLFQPEVFLPIYYKKQLLPCKYRADFICYGEIIVELKAISALADIHRSQVINYLNATRFHRALLLNFGCESLEYERLVL